MPLNKQMRAGRWDSHVLVQIRPEVGSAADKWGLGGVCEVCHPEDMLLAKDGAVKSS